LDRPTSGSVIIDEEDITALGEDELTCLRRQRIGFVFQSYNLVAVLTAGENIALPLLMDGCSKDEIEKRGEEMLELVGLSDRKEHRPSQLSGGEQQRVAIARALVNKPGIVLADEPTGNLDSIHAEEIMSLMRDVQRDNGCAIAMVTHDPKMAAYADRIVFLKDGKIIDDENLGGKLDQVKLIEGLKGKTN
jgi:putative ABC transport system ATP-binding protein